MPPSRVPEEDYGIANMTARATVRVLRDEGLVHTVHGLGTFVTIPLPVARAATANAGRTHMLTGIRRTSAPHRPDHRRPGRPAAPVRTGSPSRRTAGSTGDGTGGEPSTSTALGSGIS
ncbi:hypothetical protein ACFW6Q_06775 [Streptomyces sp. NPDC058737]|uniref:hypothetical protein n=1 Tax=Streptomyces sp. NPDC058737 TaxID=3346617 RepID=UPI0036AF104E